jgi:hypothetical protein
MPIYSIPFEPSSHQCAAPLVWYQSMGVVSVEGCLYVVPNFRDEDEQLSRIVADGTMIKRMPVSPLTGLWPNDKFFINIQYGVCIPLNHVRLVIMPLFILMCQERYQGCMRYVDEVNAALKTLQRWCRAVVRRTKQTAAAMAFHSRLGEQSALAALGRDLADMILGCV